MRANAQLQALRVALAALALTAAWAASPASALAISWNLPAQDISPTGVNGLVPDIAVAPGGESSLCWIRNTGGPNQAQAATRLSTGGLFGAPVDLSVLGQSVSFSCSVASAADGTTTAAWSAFTGSERITQAATRAAGAGSFGPLVDVSTPGRTTDKVDLAAGPDGSVTAVWESSDGSNQVIQAANRTAGSAAFSAPVTISTATPGEYAANPKVAIAASGETTVAWQLFNGSINIPQAVTRPAGSNTWGAPETLSSSFGQDVDLAYGPDGSTTATWMGDDGSNNRIEVATRAAGSGSFGAPETLSAAGQTAGVSKVAVAPDGQTTVTWQRDNGVKYVIQAATRSRPTSAFGAPVNLSDPGGDALQPRLTVAPDGAVTVVWQRSDGSNTIVQAATRPGGSETFSAPTDLSAAGRNAQSQTVATAADGSVTAAWQRRDSSNWWIVQTATSSATSYALSTATSGTGTGTVTSSPAGISCGSTCSSDFPLSSAVTLTATPQAGSTFTGWSGDCAGASSTCSLTILGNRSVTATFTRDSPAPPDNRFTITSSKVRGSSVRTRVRVPGAGRLSQRGTYRTRGTASAATRTACTTKRTASKAGTYTLTCRLNSAARKARRKGALRVRVRTTFTPTGGTPRSVARTVVFRSLKPRYTG